MARLQEWAVPSPDLDLQVTAGEQFQPPGLYLHAAGLPSAARQEAEPLITQHGCRRSPAPSSPHPPSFSYTPSRSQWLCEPRRSAQSEQKRGGVADSIGGGAGLRLIGSASSRRACMTLFVLRVAGITLAQIQRGSVCVLELRKHKERRPMIDGV